MTTAYGESAYGELPSGGNPPVEVETREFSIGLDIRVFTRHTITQAFDIAVELPKIELSTALSLRVFTRRTISTPLTLHVFGDPTWIWSPVVFLDGAELSESVTGRIRITTEENASAVASVEIVPDTGNLDPLDWTNKEITIDYKDDLWQDRRYTGVVSSPSYDPEDKTITLECTGDLQGKMEGATREQIAASIPGSRWSSDVFDDNADGWTHAQDRLKTVAGAIWTDRSGGVRFAPWAAKAAGDFLFTDDDIIVGRTRIKWPDRRQIVNRIRAEVDYRFFNLRQRDHHFKFGMAETFCEWLAQGFKLPSKQQLRSAAEGTGWALTDIHFTNLPDTRIFTCSGLPKAWIKTKYAEGLCTGGTVTLARRWAQMVDENYILDIQAPDSIEATGERGVAEGYGISSDFDTAEWERDHEFEESSGAASLHEGGSGDLSEEADPDRRSDMEEAQRVILAKGETEILETHRGTEVQFEIPMRPGLDLSHTVELQGDIGTRAKIKRIVEELDVETGRATQTITLAVSRHDGTGIGSGTPLEPADRPTATSETPYQRHIQMGFRVGPGPIPTSGLKDVELDDDDWLGFSTNKPSVAYDPSLYFYPEGMTITTPDIEEAAVNGTVLQAPKTYNIQIPQDPLVVTK